MPLLFLEFLGTSEMLIIALVALIIFGPRKLPELGRSLGKSIGEFKRASEDFKRTWEREVEVERIERELRPDETARTISASPSLSSEGAAAMNVSVATADGDVAAAAAHDTGGGESAATEQPANAVNTTTTTTVARSSARAAAAEAAGAGDARESASDVAATAPDKQDWL